MNDINLDETVFNNIKNGQQIKFTITGEYQFFYVNYPTENFDLNITITISDSKAPVLICKKCTCFDIKGNGYIKLKHKDDCIHVPVYTTRILGNIVNKYLYPEFNYLRDLFYNITVLNSLTPPEPFHLDESNSIIKIIPTSVITCGISNTVGACNNRLFGYYDIVSGNLVEVVTSIYLCPNNQIYELIYSKFKYSWDNTSAIVISQLDQNVYFNSYLYHNDKWYTQGGILLTKTTTDNIFYHYSLPKSSYENDTHHSWVKFGISAIHPDFLTPTNNRFEMTIERI
jgi:hypothetical protein